MKVRWALLAGLVSACPAQLWAQAPNAAPDWNLVPVFSSAGSAATERAAIEAQLPGLARWRGKLADPAAARAALDARSALRARVARLQNWADMRLAHDAGDGGAMADAGSGQALSARLSAAIAYMEPELVTLGPPRLTALAADPRLERHRTTLERLAARAPHVLSAEGEAIVAGVAPLQGAPATIHDVFTNGELPWPTITVQGAPRELTLKAFGAILAGPDRDARRTAWEAISVTRARFKQTQASLLSSYLAGAAWEAKLRHWLSQAELITANEPMPPGAFDALAGEAEAAVRGPLARYTALKARVVGVPALASYDLAAPFVADTRTYTIDEAKALTLQAVAPLGSDYRDRLAKGLSGQLMDWRPGKTKRPGASTFYVAADLPGYVEVNFTGEYDSVSALAHEWGHWMHWEYSRTSGRPFDTLFPPTTVGDTPSYLHELLLGDLMISKAETRAERIVALNNEIEILRRTYYNVLATVSFDLSVRAAADREETLDADHVSALYCTARKRFAPQSIAWDERDCLGWTTEPNEYYDLYFYRYMLAVSAAAWFAEGIERHDPTVIGRYKTLLSAGGSADAGTLLKAAGLDPASPEAYAPMTRRLTRLTDQLEQELAASSEQRR